MILFFILSFVCILSSILLITNKNPVYSVLFLVLLFVCGSILLLLLGVDFLPFVFILVYVGAVAVLFLFVVIILDIKDSSKSSNFKQIPLIFFASLVVFGFLKFATKDYIYIQSFVYKSPYDKNFDSYNDGWYINDDTSSLNALGQLLYTHYVLHFVIGGLILLVAIIGAIVLTSRRKSQVLKQKIFKQVQRIPYVGKNKNI